MEIQMPLKEAENREKQMLSQAKSAERTYVDAMAYLGAHEIAHLPRYKPLDQIIFCSFPIVAFGVGVYLLFLRSKKKEIE